LFANTNPTAGNYWSTSCARARTRRTTRSRSDSSSPPIAFNTTTRVPCSSDLKEATIHRAHERRVANNRRTSFDFVNSSIVIVTMSGNAAQAGGEAAQRTTAGSNGAGVSSNRIQVSNTKKPLFFYVNLAKVYVYLRFCANGSSIHASSPNFGWCWFLSTFCVACRGTCSSTAMSSSPRSGWVRTPCIWPSLINSLQGNIQ
jgi:hypothetical protein